MCLFHCLEHSVRLARDAAALGHTPIAASATTSRSSDRTASTCLFKPTHAAARILFWSWRRRACANMLALALLIALLARCKVSIIWFACATVMKMFSSFWKSASDKTRMVAAAIGLAAAFAVGAAVLAGRSANCRAPRTGTLLELPPAQFCVV